MRRVTEEGDRDNPLGKALRRLARRPWRAALVIFTLSLSVQGSLLARIPPDVIRPHTRRELPAVAVSLATTGRFADPYVLPTGPTAHLPPIPPAVFALVYWLFGLTLTAGYVAWLLTMATCAAAWAMLPWLAPRVGLSAEAGVLAGLGGSLVPRLPGLHGEGLAAAAMGLLAIAFVQRWESGRSTPGRSLLLGLAAGASFHVQPALLPVVLGWMAFELCWSRDRRKWPLSALLALGIVVACLPWGVRNYRTFGAVFFVRSNLGLELRMGNHDGAAAAMEVMDRQQEHVHVHPRALEEEARKVRELGEVVYMRQAGREALDWIRAHPGSFVGLTASRAAHWWLGPLYDPPVALAVTTLTMLALIGAGRSFPTLSAPQRAALLMPPAAFSLIYYVVAYMPRYREPLDWILLLGAGQAIWGWMGGRASREGKV
jgi:hypothetical protein